jgi:capsular exopolysaccharide synthesis family protein
MSDNRVELERIPPRDEASMIRPGYPGHPDYMDAYHYGYDYEATGNSFHLRNIWRAIRRHKLLVTVIPILVTFLILVEVNRPRPIYEASATVEIKKDAWVVVKSGDSVIEEEGDTSLSSPTIKTNTLMIKSRPVLLDVASRLALNREPEFFDITRKKKSFFETLKELSPMAEAAEPDGAQEKARPRKTGPAKRVDSGGTSEKADSQDEISEEEKAILQPYVGVILDNLNVEPIRDTRALKISFVHTNPNIAAAVANGIAESFIDRSFQNKTNKINRATAWLERTTQDLKTKVAKTEQALANYTREHNIYEPDAKGGIVSDKLTQLHAQALRSEMDRVLKESLYEEVRAGRISQLPEVFADPKIAALQTELGQLTIQAAQLDLDYGPKNPQVVIIRQRMAAIKTQIDASRTALEKKLEAEYGRAVRDEKTLKTALEQAKSEAVQQNQAAVQYNLLKQEADTTRALYTQFLQKTNQANIQLAEQPSNVRVIEPAEVPSHPVTSNRPLYIFLGFFASFTACVGIAFLFEHLSKTIKSVEDVNRYIQLPAIGVIPDIKAQTSRHLLAKNGKQKQATDGSASGESVLGLSRLNTRPVVSFDDRSMVAEAYRAVSTSVLLSSVDSPPKTILVTSGLAGEGKTTTAVNTAISLAQFGASVLIIDCDLRNPTGHKVFNLDNSRGLSTYLSSDVEIDSVICKLKIPNLSMMTAGPIPHNPAKLVISRKMKLMLQTLGERYDHILIDSPPLIGVTDAIILSTLVDGVIVVVHGNKSTREIARRTRQELSNVGANIFGVVLNNIDNTDYQYYQPAYKYIDSNAESA